MKPPPCLGWHLGVCHGPMQATGYCKAHDDWRRHNPEDAKAMGITVRGSQMDLV